MKLHLPKSLREALASAASAVVIATVATGSAAHGAVTYDGDALTTALRDDANNVYNDGAGTFYLLTRDNTLDITLTICLESLSDYQDIHDYTGSSPLVTWAYDIHPDLPYGIADYKSGDGEKSITGYWNGTAWTDRGTVQLTDLQDNYSVLGDDNKHYVTLNITNNPSANTNQVQVTATNPSTGVATAVYMGNGLKSSDFNNTTHVESVYVNTLYVTSLTLNSLSTLDVSTFEPPKDYSIPFVSQRADAPETSVGRIMFIGDSITHGEWDMTWRWQLFKTFVDNGIENEIVGPRKGFNHTTNGSETVVYTSEYTDDAKSEFSYRGVTSDNVHYAQSSGRTRNIISGNAVTEQIRDAEGNLLSTTNVGASYGGNSADKVGNKYDCNTYAMMIGTNDLLSDTNSGETAAKYAAIMSNLLGGATEGTVNPDGSYSYTWTPGAANGGHMGAILDEMNMTEGDTFYVLAVPTWALSSNHNADTDHSTVGDYNGFLKTWTENYNDAHAATVKFVDINKGLVDKTSSCEFFSNKAFFNNHNDGLHPSEQGSLIIAGNLAQAMGIGGRTGGLSRAAAGTPDTVWNTESRQTTYSLTSGSESATAGADFFTHEGGYTIDFNANFGDGSANGWLDAEKDHSDAQIITPSVVSNALSITVGDGALGGTLKLSEGYILWHDSNGDNLLYCRDNSEISSDNLRIAYNVGSTEDNIVAGYYVWLGDMLIGQGLNGTAGVANGISFSVSGTGTGAVKGLTFSNMAYAPATEGAFYASAISTPHFNLLPMSSHDNANTVVSSGITWGADVMAIENNQYGVNNASYFTDGIAKVKLTDLDGWFAAGACTATGDVQALVSDSETRGNAFAWQSGTLTGDVTMQFSNSTIEESGYRTNNVYQYASIAGSYGGASITGAFSAYVDNCTLAGDMVGGALNGEGSIGAVQFVVNSGTINGSIYGGSKTAGTVGNGVADSEGNFSNTAVAITINGGHITGSVDAGGPAGTVNGNAEIIINGGIIDHDVTDGSVIDENGNVTRRANQGKTTVTIQSNKAFIGGNITADTVNLMNVGNSGASDGFDRYAGTITATNLTLDNYTAGLMDATLVTDNLTAANGTVATIHGLQLRNCSIDATGAAALTLGESVTSGNTISYSGDIRLEDGTSFTIANPTPVTLAEEGFATSYYIYKVANGKQGRLLAADGTELTETHTATFTGEGNYLEGASFSYDSATGALIALNSNNRRGNYNIISSTVDYSAINTASSITMSGGRLNLDTALASGTAITATGGTVSIASGVTLAQASLTANGATKLAGEGAYALASGSLTLPGNISLDSTWTGTVCVTEAAFGSSTPGQINALANAGSWVGLSGCTGWLPSSTIAANLRLENLPQGEGAPPAPAVKMTSGSSDRKHTFSGSIAGSGDFVIDMSSAGAGTTNITYDFSGDVSKWTGTFMSPSTTTGAFTVQFTGAGDIGTSIDNKAGRTLNVTIGGAGNRTMNGSIANTGTLNLTVGSGGAKTFKSAVEATALTVQANTQLTFDGKLSLTNGLWLQNSGASVVLNGGYSATNGVSTASSGYRLLLNNGTSATINCAYATTHLLGHFSGSTLTFGENADVTVGGIYADGDIGDNGTLTINAGATVTSTGNVKSNTLNLNGTLTVQGDLGVNTLNMSGGTLTYTKDTAATLANVNVSGEQTSTISGKTNVTGTLKVDSSSLTFDGGAHTIAKLFGEDSADRTGVVTLRNQAAVSARELSFGARGEKYEVESGSSLSITGNSIKVEAATDAEKATMYATYDKVNGKYSYGLGKANFVMENAKVTLTNSATVKNKLANAEVVADAAGENKTVIFDHRGNTLKSVKAQAGNVIVSNAGSSAASLKSIKAEGGDVTLQGLAEAAELTLTDLAISANKTVTALTGSATTHEDGQNNVANIVIGNAGRLAAGNNATLNANLTMNAGSTLSMANGGSLDMGCALTLNKGMKLATDDATETSMSTYDSVLATGYDTRWLYTSVESLTLEDVGTLSYIDGNIVGDITKFNGIDASAYFTNLASGTYFLSVVDNGAQSFDVGITAPEPATATLGLLALCALAARRRRKQGCNEK